jgi:hypothetical protein
MGILDQEARAPDQPCERPADASENVRFSFSQGEPEPAELCTTGAA